MNDAVTQLFALGLRQYRAGQFELAESSFHDLVQLQPDNAEAWYYLGLLGARRKAYGQAIERLRRAIEIKPGKATFHGDLGNALTHQGKLREAVESYRHVLRLKPDSHQAHNNLGTVLQDQGTIAEAIESYQRAIRLKPDFHQAHNNLGTALQDQGKLQDAIASYTRALQLEPGCHQAHNNLGNVLQDQGHLEDALGSYQRALDLQPDSLMSQSQYIWTKRRGCEWSALAPFEQSIVTAARSDESGSCSISPFLLLALTDDNALQLRAAQRYSRALGDRPSQPLWQGCRYNHDRIRLAYLSADYSQHATACLATELFEKHDRSRFELFAISFGPEDASPIRRRLEDAFDHFIDVRQMPHLEAAKEIRGLEIDIAVDLKGHTKYSRPQILAHRPAPIQVSYLGYPGTMGAAHIDYILVDPFVVPPDRQRFFTEKLVHLPDCYQVNKSSSATTGQIPTRCEHGLPDQAFVFSCFSNSYKITPPFFDVWMRLLHAVPNSVLWLLSDSKWVQDNLRREARNRAVDPGRLVFGKRQSLPDHYARHQLADLALDTFPYNGHTTTSDALRNGLPVLTCAGQSFAARVAGSLLHTLGLPELVTGNRAAYEALALRLATEPERLQGIRRKVARNRHLSPVFDTERFCKSIEAAYTTMWSAWQDGKQPSAFTV